MFRYGLEISLTFLMKSLKFAIPVLVFGLLSACASITNWVGTKVSDNLTLAVMNSEDMWIIEHGLPAYLIMVDAMIEANQNNVAMLLSGARLNGSYATAFVSDVARQKVLSEKALRYALRAACLDIKWMCEVRSLPFDEFDEKLAQMRKRKLATSYGLASAWAGYIQVNSDDWHAVAELPRVKALMKWVAELDPTLDGATPYMYLGIFESLLPPAMGGNPDLARRHFEQAVELRGEDNLYIKVMFAEFYARLVYDRELHDELLAQVLEADIVVDGLRLQNEIAQIRATELLGDADDYF